VRPSTVALSLATLARPCPASAHPPLRVTPPAHAGRGPAGARPAVSRRHAHSAACGARCASRDRARVVSRQVRDWGVSERAAGPECARFACAATGGPGAAHRTPPAQARLARSVVGRQCHITRRRGGHPLARRRPGQSARRRPSRARHLGRPPHVRPEGGFGGPVDGGGRKRGGVVRVGLCAPPRARPSSLI
jgi:hypothetical protein